MESQKVFEQHGTQSALQPHDKADRLSQYGGQVASGVDIATQLLRNALLLAPLQLQQDMFLGGEVKEKGAMCHAGGCHDRADVSRSETGSLELGDGGSQESFASLE